MDYKIITNSKDEHIAKLRELISDAQARDISLKGSTLWNDGYLSTFYDDSRIDVDSVVANCEAHYAKQVQHEADIAEGVRAGRLPNRKRLSHVPNEYELWVTEYPKRTILEVWVHSPYSRGVDQDIADSYKKYPNRD